MVQLIRNKGLFGVLTGLVIIVLSKWFFDTVPDTPQVTYTPLFAALKTRVSAVPYLDITLGLTFMVLQGILLTFFLNYHKVIKERSFFTFIIYIMVAGVYSEQFYLNPASFLNFFLILIIDRMLKLQDIGKNPGTLFLDIGTLAGCTLLFSKEAMFYLPIIVIGVIIVYTYSSNSIIIMLMSMFIVMFITACIYYLSNSFGEFGSFFSFNTINIGISYSHWQERFYVLLGLIVALSIIAFVHFQFTSSKITNKTRRFAGVFDLLWFVALLIVVFQQLNLWTNMALFAIPISVFATSYFQEEKGMDWFKNLVFFIFIAGLISVQLNY